MPTTAFPAPELPGRVLVVEGRSSNGRSLTRLISEDHSSFVAHAEGSFSSAVQRLHREEHIDALVLDLTLPASGGVAALRRLHEERIDLPVVVITDDDDDVVLEAMRGGAQDFLVKDRLTANSLQRALRHAIERHRAEQQLHRSSRLQTIGQLAGGMAHDFNNIILVIQSCCEVLLERAAPDSEDAEIVNEIRTSADRGAALIRQILAFSRQQILAPSVLDLSQTVRETSHLLERLIGEDIELRIVDSSERCTVRADAGQMQQILMNLAANSRDAIPRHGTLYLETRCVEIDAAFSASHRPQPPGPYVLLSVRDTGVGMDDRTRRRLFEPFFSTKPDGSGLGLATTYGIVKQSGGYIWVTSDPGSGTKVDMYFPRVEGQPAPPPEEPRRRPAADRIGGDETILLVEDDPVVRRLTKRALERHGYSVLVAESGHRALEVFEDVGSTVDLLMTDVVMPRLSGPALAEQLNSVRPDLRVLYLSGYPTESVMRHGLLDPARNFLEKPFSREALLRKVRQVLSAAAQKPS